MQVSGLQPRQGDPAFAFFVIRLDTPARRSALIELLRGLAALVPDPEALLPEDLDEPLQILAVPWMPPATGAELDNQRRAIERAQGVVAAWFFQTGTSLPSAGDDDDDEAQADSEDATHSTDDGWAEDATEPVALVETDEDEADGDGWSHGPPPQCREVRFPVDGYPAIVEQLDWEDFGIAFKLAGPRLPGENTVLLAFHTLWLAPYAGRYRNAAVTYDHARHAAHLWVDRFAVPSSSVEQVGHLLWVLARLDEIVPVVHGRFAGATMAQKYGGLMGETGEPLVLGGNPLVPAYAERGLAAVDAVLAQPGDWSRDELARMLRELALEVVTAGSAGGDPDDEDEDDEDDELVYEAEDEGGDDDDDDDGDDDEDDDDDDDNDDDNDDDDEAEGNDDDDRGRQIASHAGDVLRARALIGKLDPRAAERLLPVLAQPGRHEQRRRAVVDVLGALRYRPAVPALIRILEETTLASAEAPTGKEDFLASTAAALGSIADPAALTALGKVVAASGSHNDDPRVVAADALASCLAAAPEPRDVDEAVLAQLLATIRERNDGELNAESHLAYGRIARQLRPERRDEAKRRLVETDSARDDATAMLARQAALVLASPKGPAGAPPRDLQPLLHDGLTALDYDHDYTVRNLRVALRVAEVVPELVDPADLVWLTRFAEPDVRTRAHALLAQLGHEMPPARICDAASVRELADVELVQWIAEPHLVGRATLIAEAGRRGIAAARRAIIDACHDVVSRARQGGSNLLDPDTRVLEAAIPILRVEPVDGEVITLFDRMLRHSNFHVKWELMHAPPSDPRLIGGMFHVLGEKWGWQEKSARQWLQQFQGSEAYEAERRRAGTPPFEHESEPETDGDDQEMN